MCCRNSETLNYGSRREINTWSGDSDQRKLLPYKPPSFSPCGCFLRRYQRKKKPSKLLKLEGLHPVYLTLIPLIYNRLLPVSPQRDDHMLGRSSDSRFVLVSAPSHLVKTSQWHVANFVTGHSGGTALDSHEIPY
jgi:hypothetical protein